MDRAARLTVWTSLSVAVVLGLLWVAAVQCLPDRYTDYDAVYLTREGGAGDLLRFMEKTLRLPSLPPSASDPHLYALETGDPLYYGAFTVDATDVPALLSELGLSAEDRTTTGLYDVQSFNPPKATRSWFAPADQKLSVWNQQLNRGRRYWWVDEEHGRFWFWCY